MNPPLSESQRAPRAASHLLDKRLLFVTGKGGVGKSTVAAALGLMAARRGMRTIVAELARRDDVSRVLGGHRAPSRSGEEVQLAEKLFWTTLDPESALQEYLEDQLPVRALADMLTSSRLFTYLAAATPGLAELLTVGKVWELAQPERRRSGDVPYDLVIVDAPATGHGLAFLAAPSTFVSVARVGPIARQARIIAEMLSDPARTAVLAVSTPSETPVNEVGLLRRSLRDAMGLELSRVIINGLHPQRFTAAEAAALADAMHHDGELPTAALRAALALHGRAREQRNQVARLRRMTGTAPATLPFLFSSALGLEDIGRLADRLERRL
jgi:anion-transporting  ArsA/GET3 family ATPase